MFLKDFDKFKHTVEDTMTKFFDLTPEQIEENIAIIESTYSRLYDLDKVNFKDVSPENRDIIMRYRTLKYFHQIYTKVNELDELLKGSELNDTN
ncbi:MAG: hypothetical protein IKS48_00565 [Eubacterium sp.]|nr:hypothetical protein [Eubacterium sp.]